MLGGMNPRQMQGMMKKMGIQQQEVDAQEVIIVCSDQTIRITNPSVVKVNMMGQKTYQISGEETVEHKQIEEEVIEVSEEDIQTVMSQTGVTEQEAMDALADANGDLAGAIIKLQK
jgi:nascent polypeptide-associated complex subunit alpha